LILSDIDSLEVLAERFDEHLVLVQREAVNRCCERQRLSGVRGMLSTAPGLGADALDQVKRGVSVLLADNLAQQIPQEADISTWLAQTLVHTGPFNFLSRREWEQQLIYTLADA